MQRSKPDSTDRSVTSTPPRATRPDDVLGHDLRRPHAAESATEPDGCAVVKASSGLVVPGVLLPLGTIRRISFIRRIRIPAVVCRPVRVGTLGRAS